MKHWDLSTGIAKLEEAMDKLKHAACDSLTTWDDQTNRDFQQQRVYSLEPYVERTIDAVHRLSEVLGKAQRACDSRYE